MPEGTTEIRVGGEGGSLVVVGNDLFGSVPSLLGQRVAKVLIVHAPTLGARANELRTVLVDAGLDALIAEVPDAEAAKRIEVAAFCWQVMGQADFTRTDAVIGLGGGAVTDLAGFVAATWLRGVPFLAMPTSVLGLVDASVGGKTGINTNEGKNLVGAFHHPRAVIADLDLVRTLPRNDVLTGFAEIVKAGFIAVPEILDVIEADVDRVTDPTTPEFRRVVELAIALKAEVVSEDFTEQGRREVLNYGHTLGHAIEHAERYQWRHGAAVSVGMVFAAELARLTGHLDDATVDRHRTILESLELPTSYGLGRWEGLLATMRRDKKARAGMLRFIILDGVGKPVTLEGPEDHLLFTAYQEVGV
ncbi:3-dehydroquinate synthase [Curtobacterium citreum]|uniref:3-dehydroquinate synthase n=1 Tax=Curtobacterium citreum TaxID=2036 RepID=UPI0024E24C1B